MLCWGPGVPLGTPLITQGPEQVLHPTNLLYSYGRGQKIPSFLGCGAEVGNGVLSHTVQHAESTRAQQGPVR